MSMCTLQSTYIHPGYLILNLGRANLVRARNTPAKKILSVGKGGGHTSIPASPLYMYFFLRCLHVWMAVKRTYS